MWRMIENIEQINKWTLKSCATVGTEKRLKRLVNIWEWFNDKIEIWLENLLSSMKMLW